MTKRNSGAHHCALKCFSARPPVYFWRSWVDRNQNKNRGRHLKQNWHRLEMYLYFSDVVSRPFWWAKNRNCVFWTGDVWTSPFCLCGFVNSMRVRPNHVRSHMTRLYQVYIFLCSLRDYRELNIVCVLNLMHCVHFMFHFLSKWKRSRSFLDF